MKLAMSICLAMVFLGCGPSDLEGEWEITLPAGFRYESLIERLDDNRYDIPSIAVLSGIYERRGDSLFVVEPNDSRLTEFVWKIEDLNTLTLVTSPPVGKIGSDYTGAKLRRLK